MEIKNFTACDGWYFVERDSKLIFKVAGWALLESGDIVGMIAPTGARTSDQLPRLTTPPSAVDGHYVPAECLTDRQQALARRL
ncbi:hypothetical protein HDG34_005934 [Paraburkholderia sp. HC6.4b]|uniref:hypothetical protein n=1 Tax=unclassified Paraburkholderia TaxID=2615204 RepID=UPI00160F8257|nr:MULTISPECIES: hypothetical protein [unclassified Paraburkholderia]MBB5411968.1 hypothetical protein [Paraburkholderia sp. HC6.4b]MBB5454035.1 hypothetical protein [Paraburkholderia sp. Kb1A]